MLRKEQTQGHKSRSGSTLQPRSERERLSGNLQPALETSAQARTARPAGGEPRERQSIYARQQRGPRILDGSAILLHELG